LITAMLQSSSTTTAMTVALVASGSLSIQSAVPIIMGANVGTTITSVIVALPFISEKKEFRRAVSAGTYHCFFNLLTLVILFPLEYYYGFLSSLSQNISGLIPFVKANPQAGTESWLGFDFVIHFLRQAISNGFILITISFSLLFGSVLLFRKVISDLVKARSPEAFARFFFRNPLKSFGWGLATTAAIRSSTVTTSVVVPIVAKKIATLQQAAPFIMGANVGTTITAMVAAIFNTNSSAGVSIAIAHVLFNLIGVVVFFPVSALRKIPIELASGLGRLTLRFPLASVVFILLTFFFIPFCLIYFNQEQQQLNQYTYERSEGGSKSQYRISSRINSRNQIGEWIRYEGSVKKDNESPALIYPVYFKGKSLFIGNQMYLFSKPGYCWDGEDEQGKYQACVEKIMHDQQFANYVFDSVYVFKIRHFQPGTSSNRVYLSALNKVVLKKEVLNSLDSLISSERLVRFEKF
jgi:sodium-dependent phosphate cotransporter